MTVLRSIITTPADSPGLDAFGRQRVSEPHTIFDSKQIFDNSPLFWDDQETSGSGTGSTHSTDTASSEMTVSNTTAGTRIRQTFKRFNYEPGKSQEIIMTGVLGTGGTGLTQRIGLFDNDNGLCFTVDGGTLQVTRRTSVTGSAVDTDITQASWNLDTLDGNGPSGKTIDLTKTQIFIIDFEWLGVGRVRFGFNIDGETYYCHEMDHANSLTEVYMSTPNLPLRYEISNDGTGAAATLKHICSSVISEGGTNVTGILRYKSTEGTHIDANVADTLYAVVGIRLKSTHVGCTVDLVQASLLAETNDDFEWSILINPSIAGTFTYSDLTNSCVQTATGATANTVTGGTALYGGWATGNSTASGTVENAFSIGSAIDGTVDELVLCVRPLTTNLDIQGSITWRELL